MDPCECDLRAGPLTPKLQRDRFSRVCRAHSCDQQTRVDRALYMCGILTSCCSTDSERPHQCCHLPNNLVSSALAGYSLYSQWAGKFPQNWAFLWEYGPQLATWFHDYTISPLFKWKLNRFNRFGTAEDCERDRVTNSQTHKQCTETTIRL